MAEPGRSWHSAIPFAAASLSFTAIASLVLPDTRSTRSVAPAFDVRQMVATPGAVGSAEARADAS